MVQHLSLEHWNKKLLLAIDIKTNSDCLVDGQIVEIGAVFVDIDGKIVEGQPPLSLLIRPYTQNKLTLKEYEHYCMNGVEESLARSTLMYWLDNSVMSTTKDGSKRKAMLVGFEIGKAYGFLNTFLGVDYCNQMFHPTLRDIPSLAMYINDVYANNARYVKFQKYDFKWVIRRCPMLRVPLKHQVDCISKAYSYAAMYVSMYKYILKPLREE